MVVLVVVVVVVVAAATAVATKWHAFQLCFFLIISQSPHNVTQLNRCPGLCFAPCTLQGVVSPPVPLRQCTALQDTSFFTILLR